jgi:hypothetical protein
MNKALRHEEPDRVPISDFFWGTFEERWKKEMGLPEDASPFHYYDLDWVVTLPNMDPRIQDFEIIREDENEVLVKTGFRATLRKKFADPMPEFFGWDTNSIEKLEKFEFDPPSDARRFFSSGDNEISGVGDSFARNTEAWIDTVKKWRPDFPVYGSVIECSECLTRLIGQQNAFLWMGMDPDRMGSAINRIGQFYLDLCKAELEAGKGLLDGFVIWGDVAYQKGLFFNPDYWRKYFKPWVRAMVEECKKHDLPVIYHGCGNVNMIFEDFIEIGIDAVNPLEVKAGMDAFELKKKYGNRIAYCGNADIQVWETNDKNLIKKDVLRTLRAASEGGLIFMSDHSVTRHVSGHSYDYIVKLVKEFGRYPLDIDLLERQMEKL